jgi:hypothetical protein
MALQPNSFDDYHFFIYECQIINYFLHRSRDKRFISKNYVRASKFGLRVQYCLFLLSDRLINQTLTAPKSGEKSIKPKFSARTHSRPLLDVAFLIYLRLFLSQTNKSLAEYKRQKNTTSKKAKDDSLNLENDGRKMENNEADYNII